MTVSAPAPAQQAAQPATAAPRTFSECVRSYVGRTDAATYCRRLFPATAPAAPAATTTPAATTLYDRCVAASGRTAEARGLCAQRYPDSAPKASEPVDITPQLNKLIESLGKSRPKPKPPADPLAVIPAIQAACAQYAGAAQRWLRCTADGWRQSGLRGQPPLALQTPPAPPPSTPPVVVATVQDPPPVRPDTTYQAPPKPEVPKPKPPQPPVSTEAPPPVEPPAPPVTPTPPVVAVQPPSPPTPEPLPPKASIPLWVWLAGLAALAVAGVGGFGLAKWLGRPRPPRPAKVEAAPCAPPQITLVADPGIVALTTDGPPRAGMAVSMRFVLDDGEGEVRLDHSSLETAP